MKQHPSLVLGLAGFAYEDLFTPAGLARLHAVWLADLAATHPDVYTRYEQAVQAGTHAFATPEAHSAWLLEMAPHVSRFAAQLFGPETVTQAEAVRLETQRLQQVFALQERFAKRYVHRRAAPAVCEELDAQACALLADWGCTQPTIEAAVARAVLDLLAHEQRLAADATQQDAWRHLRTQVETLADWVASHKNGTLAHWRSLHVPNSLDYEHLVPLERLRQHGTDLQASGHRRERDGFDVTDPRGSRLDVQAEVAYCLYCHTRGKDSCRTGLRDKQGEVRTNPLGVPVPGCPLDEKISEMHTLHREGDALAALAVVCLDNPLCPGTGHRICNDCMKACVYQKQEPVNTPQVETGVLTDVLALPWGVELYGLLTRWNPLNHLCPVPRPFNGRHVMVVGLGPAGYTLAHWLAREGFGVVGIDGLKLEPPPQPYSGNAAQGQASTPVYAWEQLTVPLSQRLIAGFGGVSEYGITARWDKNFLSLLYLTLSRNPHIHFYGSVRFGGTVTLEQAWDLGFDHVALATGAGRSILLEVRNNLARGMRQASDFLMTLQGGGAFQRQSLTNLHVRLPAVVIGGGLTALDTATELQAYYVTQVEKVAAHWHSLTHTNAGVFDAARHQALWSQLTPEEQQTLSEWLTHAQAFRDERAQAAREQRAPHLQALLQSWGGVTVVYRKRLIDSPAYRLNHEEVANSLEEGIRYAECLAPQEITLDANKAASAVVFAKQTLQGERWVTTDERVTLPARTVCVAAGTRPNTTYETEHPGHFAIGPNGYFVPHTAQPHPDGTVTLTADPLGVFTSYHHGLHTVGFYGDNHPRYAGSVVKAMASAKDGSRQVAALYQPVPAHPTQGTSPRATSDFASFCTTLDSLWRVTVVQVNRLTPSVVEVVVQAPAAAQAFQPGQFYRLQHIGAEAKQMEALALTGARTDAAQGLLSLIVLELGASSELCQFLQPGMPVSVMGPTGAPTILPRNQRVCLIGGGLGNAVLFSIAQALKGNGCQVLYIAGYRRPEDRFAPSAIEAASDQVIWACEVDPGSTWNPRPQDRVFVGNVIQALLAYAQGTLGKGPFSLREVQHLLAIGSDRMMHAVQQARQTLLRPYLSPQHTALGSINAPMQCMMKEICAQCLQRQVDPATGRERFVFTCSNQDQPLDCVDFDFLSERLSQNTLQEKLARWEQQRLHNPATVRSET